MNSIDALLRPSSVAIVGASNDVNKIGGRPIGYMRSHGFAGELYPVSQRGDPVQGIRSYRSLDDLPQAPDSVILSVPATSALEQIRACVRVGARGAVLFSSGFGEMGRDGVRAQAQLAEEARAGGLRLLGPNTIGTANFGCGAVLTFASIYQEYAPQDGPAAIISQSGAIGASAYSLLRENGIGVRYVCATGNQADVEVSELVACVVDDPQVRIVLLYLEEVRDPRKLSGALAAARARGVPVLVLASARTAGGARMAAFHTGSAGMTDPALAQLFAAQGCRVASSLTELSASVPLYLLEGTTSAAPLRVGLVSNSGASCVLAADACDAQGLRLADFNAATRAQLDVLLPAFSRSRNPVDLTAMLLADSAMLGRSVATVLGDPGCDALALSLLAVAGAGYDVERFAADTASALRAQPKPAAFSSPHARVRAAFAAEGLAVFMSEADAVAALNEHHQHRRQAAALA
ncbi:hypothetical protein FN976_00465 [Caenimonas sedimenti]|uniref:CoA-binding domain-containing protein n=1 Tax=Caenimonas sedimenti TaxID=2596921 RepID=A0A562ZXZ4_9BURK|nr:CoA-binding protein [Caenimonas sedimenti]TWO73353.1 hypothetical protein FN976_00465 [Caenimonas sedimenti]